MVGKRLSHYKILEELGRGGMGIVYTGEDTKLHRTVAIKVLPAAALSSDDDRARFYREARAAASLSHPNIAVIHEIDEAVPEGSEDDDLRPFIAMEFIEGDTLEDRIKQGPMKLEEAVRIASEVSSGLEAAHKKDIVHRDIKAANVMLDGDGRAKILDFGLAQTTASTKLTRMGSTLGTVAYMSPEQARGEEVDARTDLWALGVTLYEMIAGRHPFAGDYEQAVVYSIMNEDPEPLTAVRTGVPMGLEWIVLKCLAKKAADRYQTGTDLLVDLRNVDLSTSGMSRISDPSLTVSNVATREPHANTSWTQQPKAARLRTLSLIIAVVAALITGFVARGLFLGDSEENRPERGLREVFISSQPGFETAHPEFSPTESYIAYRGDSLWHFALIIQDMATGRKHKVNDPWFVYHPRFSPDGQWIVYQGQQGLSKVSVPNGTPILLESAADGELGVWESNTHILYGSIDGHISRVSANGGDPVRVANPDSSLGHRSLEFPAMLPSSKYFMATAITQDDSRDVVIVDLRTGEYDVIINGAGYARYISTGHLIYIAGGAARGQVVAQSFDIGRHKLSGPRKSTPIGVRDISEFSVGSEGTIAVSEKGERTDRKFSWISTRDDSVVDLSIEHDNYDTPAISPDGTRIVSSIRESEDERNLFLIGVLSGTRQQLTFDGTVYHPSWSADGQYIFYQRGESGERKIYRRRADGAGAEELIPISAALPLEATPSPDGKWLAYRRTGSSSYDVWAYNLSDGTDVKVADFEGGLLDPVFSPNGKFVAFERNVGGGQRLAVQEFQGDGNWLLSGDELRAWDPKWSPDGKYLYYRNPTTLFRVPVTFEPTFTFGAVEEVRSLPSFFQFDLDSDTERILISSTVDESSNNSEKIRLIENFDRWLRENAPADN